MTSKHKKGQTVGYVRVSSLDQNTERQREGEAALDKVFIDKVSGKDAERPQLRAALEYLREGDTLQVHSMDRLARNLDDLRRIVRELTGRGVTVRFVKESLTFTGDDSPMAILLLSMMGAFAEFERSLIRERQREGIAIAKQKGVYKGRKKALSEAQVEALVTQDKANGGKNRAALAREVGVSRETLYQYLREAGVVAG
ncbi:MAG: transposase [Hydrogenophilales bacterium RIFOXYD1_FULL_62_11]|nr:MAG: transposase [Hydrogenophilales bacterium RIFOXYD1_FULL_62_11]